MAIIYALVANGDGTVLAEHAATKGNTAQVAADCMQHVKSSSEPRMTITCDNFNFNYLKSGGFIFLAVADEAFGRQVPFACVERVAEAWQAGPAAKAGGAAAGSYNRSFGPKIKEITESLNANPEAVNRVAAVQKQVDDVKSVMVENISKVLERGDRIQLLVDRTEDLQAQAVQFQKQGRQLRSKMWWANVKVKLAVIFAVLLVLAVIVLVACFSGGNRCIPKKQEQPPPDSPNP